MELKQPTTNTQEVLHTLITQGYVSILDFPYLSGFRTRISELINDYDIEIIKKQAKGRNKFGREYTFIIHYLQNKPQATNVYLNSF